MMNKKLPPTSLAWFAWGLGAVLYVIGFFQRVAPGVMTAELMRDLGMTATALGNLSAFYFYSYVGMQIPTGILADHWGPRRLLTAGAIGAGIGSLCFALAGGFLWACIGRFLIGGSVAVAFVAMMKLSAHWMPERHFSVASGSALLLGLMGAVFAGPPLRLLIEQFGWRPVMAISSIPPLILATLIWIVVRDDPEERGYESYTEKPSGPSENPRIRDSIKKLLGYRNIRLLFLSQGAFTGSVITFAGLWGIPFLTMHYGLTVPGAAAICSAMLILWGISGPACGVLSDKARKRKYPYLAGCLVLIVSWSAIVFSPGLPLFVLVALLMLISLASGSIIVGFSYAKESVPAHLSGTAAGICNMGTMTGPMVLQPAIGWILDFYRAGEMQGTEAFYHYTSFRSGFFLILLWSVVAFVCIMFSREKVPADKTDASVSPVRKSDNPIKGHD